MGKPNPPCFKKASPYIDFITNTTTSTTIEPDFFIIPISGAVCPSGNIFESYLYLLPTSSHNTDSIFNND